MRAVAPLRDVLSSSTRTAATMLLQLSYRSQRCDVRYITLRRIYTCGTGSNLHAWNRYRRMIRTITAKVALGTQQAPATAAAPTTVGRRDMASSSSSSSSSSTGPWTNRLFDTTAIRETVKETILNEATRDDSHLWNYTSTDTGSHPQNQNHNHNHNTHSSVNQPQSTAFINNTITASDDQAQQSQYTLNGEIEKDRNLYPALNGTTTSTSISGMSMCHTSTSTINDSHHLNVDLLHDLYVTEETQYWPKLPPNIAFFASTSSSIENNISDIKMVDPFQLVRGELQLLSQSIRNDLIGTDHPVLNQAAAYFFQEGESNNGGKKVRPMMVLLLSRALSESIVPTQSLPTPLVSTESVASPIKVNGIYHSDNNNHHHSDHSVRHDNLLLSVPITGYQRTDLPQAQRRLAEISEMIHTASLFHDDVIDGSDTRRNIPTVHTVFGNKMAILAGDYLLARASICLARLRNTDVVETMSTIIEHLVRGEVMQLRGNTTSQSPSSSAVTNTNNENSRNERLLYYLRKNFYKTASLMANSCKSTALLGNYTNEYIQASYQYGKHIGMAFQLVDDVLDFEGTLLQMGKPALSDLKAGLATAPVLFAAEVYPILETYIQRKFVQENDIETTLQYVIQSNSIERTKKLARVHAECAIQALSVIRPSIYRDALIHLAYKVVSRTK
jgi:hexaprenyl-diphosphate synthase